MSPRADILGAKLHVHADTLPEASDPALLLYGLAPGDDAPGVGIVRCAREDLDCARDMLDGTPGNSSICDIIYRICARLDVAIVLLDAQHGGRTQRTTPAATPERSDITSLSSLLEVAAPTVAKEDPADLALLRQAVLDAEALAAGLLGGKENLRRLRALRRAVKRLEKAQRAEPTSAATQTPASKAG